MADLTLYFDSACPLCRREMNRLRRWDRAGRLAFVDMSGPVSIPHLWA
jgi:predicted DCC family thiol-disulfide oxidoreductase YuxK